MTREQMVQDSNNATRTQDSKDNNYRRVAIKPKNLEVLCSKSISLVGSHMDQAQGRQNAPFPKKNRVPLGSENWLDF